MGLNIMIFIFGFLVGAIFVFFQSLKTINQIHNDYKDGLYDDEEKEKSYIQSVIKADFQEAGDEDVFRKIKVDLKDHNISDDEIRKKMNELNEKAISDFS